MRRHWLIPSCVLAAAIVAAASLHVRASESTVEDLIAAAVRARMGADARVMVRGTRPSAPARLFTSALIDPVARLGDPLTVILSGGPGVSVRVQSDVTVSVQHARVARPIARGQEIVGDDMTPVMGDVVGVPVRRLPTATELAGGRAIRDMKAGDIVQAGWVQLKPAVHAGDPVTVRARIGDVEVTSILVASDNGNIGAIVRVMNPDTHRTLRARVVASGIVEVVNVR
jgi:flagellar basal body P-ring formation protein FlgA